MDISKLTGYTPGPWHFNGGNYISICDGGKRQIAKVGHKETRILDREVERNSGLIAAAPDLLELAKMGLELAEAVIKMQSFFPEELQVNGMWPATAKKARALREKARDW